MANESKTQPNDPNGSADAGARVVATAALTAPQAPTASMPARRRAMLRTLGATGPVVMTLISNPVSASTCVVASSFVSALALASRKPTSATPCAGMTPSGWRTHGSSWPSPYVGVKPASLSASSTVAMSKFKTVFGTTTGTGLTDTSTMMDALGSVSGAYGSLANYCVAALLNAQSNKVSTSVLSAAQVIALWKSTTTNGYYQPSASSSVRFTPAQTVTWLAAMMA
jgi:hypothetical protein